MVGFISADGDICNVQKPCKNGAQCTNIVGGYHCKCSGGFKGKNCDEGVCKKVRESAPKGLKKIRGAVKRTIISNFMSLTFSARMELDCFEVFCTH